MPFKQIVCLANSKKLSHRCIAGKEFDGQRIGAWIRPVSKQTPTGELSLDEMSFQDGNVPNLLDIVTVPLLEHTPHYYQTENYFVDPGYYWVKNDVFQLSMLARLCDTPDVLWINGYHSYSGYNDRIPLNIAQAQVSSSLLLIKPDTLSVQVADELDIRRQVTKRRVRADFTYKRQRYKFMITDPVAEKRFLERENGVYEIRRRDVYLCISLGEPLNNFCYKLIAGVFPAL